MIIVNIASYVAFLSVEQATLFVLFMVNPHQLLWLENTKMGQFGYLIRLNYKRK